MHKFWQSAYKLLIAPKSSDEDGQRREFIANVLLVGSLSLVLAAFIIVWLDFLILGTDYLPGTFPLILVMWFGSMFLLSRAGKYVTSAYMLVATFLVLAFYTLVTWGILLPEGILILALVVVMSSILLGTLAGMLVAGLSGVGLIALAALQQNHTVGVDVSWMSKRGVPGDAVGFAVTLAIITVVSWLSNREIERSLARARTSEAKLQKERDGLEVKVSERTKELEQSQREKIMELSRFAEFGRLTAGIVHELVTPVTTVALNLEQMHDEVHSERLRRAIEGTKRLERYIEAARKQLQHQTVESDFALSKEIEGSIAFLSPQAEKTGVEVDLVKLDDIKLHGNPIRFHQMITNLIANAISSYEGRRRHDKQRVTVELRKVDGTAHLTIRDWGSGIPPQYVDKVFDPFFTLKTTDQGIGIGLSLSKGIVENDFGGSISVISDEQDGTTFMIRIPLIQGRQSDKPKG